MPKIDVVIPVLNEEESLPKLLAAIPDFVRYVVVCDNGSTDSSADLALKAGAIVVQEPERGYGAACLKGMAWLASQDQQPDVLVYLDGDFSDDPASMAQLTDPIISDQADFVLADRTLEAQPGALSVPQRFGSWLAGGLVHMIWGVKFRDLGPFRAIRWTALESLAMQDRNYGWTVEMQIKAAQKGLRCKEISLPYYRRLAGQSKVSGNLIGSFKAGTKILYLIAKSLMTAT